MSRTQFESLGNKMHSTDEKNNNKNSDDEKNELARRRWRWVSWADVNCVNNWK